MSRALRGSAEEVVSEKGTERPSNRGSAHRWRLAVVDQDALEEQLIHLAAYLRRSFNVGTVGVASLIEGGREGRTDVGELQLG